MTYMYMYMYIHTYMYSRNIHVRVHAYMCIGLSIMKMLITCTLYMTFSYITVLQIEISCKEIVDFSYNLRSEYTYCLLHVSVHVLMLSLSSPVYQVEMICLALPCI